jgi:capsular polysaccharide biosynthesis protein
MSRMIRFLARLYPRSWRERYGAEYAALLEDVRPDGRTAANVLTGALAMQVRNWKSWGILAGSALLGAAVIAGLFVAMPNSYVSSAVLKFGEQGDRADTIDDINTLVMNVESRATMTRVITTFNLYQRERSRETLEDVIEEMKKQIIIQPLGANPAFAIRFNYYDPHVAQKVTQYLATLFLAENLRNNSSISLSVLDAASLPQSPFYPNKPLIIGFGVACFLVMWGALSARRSVSARRYATAGSSISSPELPGGGAAALSLPPIREHVRRNSGKILAAIALLIVVAALALRLANPNLYESMAVMKILPPASPRANADYIASLAQSVEDRFSLTRIITTYNLYPGERSRMPFDDVMEQMKKHIRIEPLPTGSKNVAGFLIRFSYSDPFIAQKVTQELMAQFVDASSVGNSEASLSILDYASLPEPRPFSVEPRFSVGLFFGLLLGLILSVIVALFRRSTAPV